MQCIETLWTTKMTKVFYLMLLKMQSCIFKNKDFFFLLNIVKLFIFWGQGEVLQILSFHKLMSMFTLLSILFFPRFILYVRRGFEKIQDSMRIRSLNRHFLKSPNERITRTTFHFFVALSEWHKFIFWHRFLSGKLHSH